MREEPPVRSSVRPISWFTQGLVLMAPWLPQCWMVRPARMHTQAPGVTFTPALTPPPLNTSMLHLCGRSARLRTRAHTHPNAHMDTHTHEDESAHTSDMHARTNPCPCQAQQRAGQHIGVQRVQHIGQGGVADDLRPGSMIVVYNDGRACGHAAYKHA